MSTEGKKSPLSTDMNQREREKFASQAIKCAGHATALAKSLRDGDDTATLLNLVMLSISGSFINEMHDVYLDTLPDDERAKYKAKCNAAGEAEDEARSPGE